MGLKVEDIQLVHRRIGTKHVITSPQVPELHVSHSDEATAFASIQSALDMVAAMKERIEAQKSVSAVRKERMYG